MFSKEINYLKNKFKQLVPTHSKTSDMKQPEVKSSDVDNINISQLESQFHSEKIIKEIIQWKDTVPFVFPIKGGQVIKVYDGDTITIASKLPYDESPLYRISVRLNGIDCPEIKSKNEDEKQAAKNVRDALHNLIYGKEIRLENIQTEKYGRVLADVYLGDIHINNWLIENRYAVAYDGGTKIKPVSWIKHLNTGEM